MLKLKRISDEELTTKTHQLADKLEDPLCIENYAIMGADAQLQANQKVMDEIFEVLEKELKSFTKVTGRQIAESLWWQAFK